MTPIQSAIALFVALLLVDRKTVKAIKDKVEAFAKAVEGET
jgi:hypothetical protein